MKDIELTPDGQAEVRLAIEDEHAPLRRGTQASLRTASLSGVANRYVDLQMPPGESQEAIEDGGVIPRESTTTAVDLDQVFSLSRCRRPARSSTACGRCSTRCRCS